MVICDVDHAGFETWEISLCGPSNHAYIRSVYRHFSLHSSGDISKTKSLVSLIVLENMKLTKVWEYGTAICVSWIQVASAITLDLDSQGK